MGDAVDWHYRDDSNHPGQERKVSPYDKCASCGGELTTGGCVNFACSSKVTAQLLWVNPNHYAAARDREDALRRELAETRKALEYAQAEAGNNLAALETMNDVSDEWERSYHSTRAELARSEARVKTALSHADGTRKPWAEIGPRMVEALRNG
jgi:hypothetical protein